MLTGINKKISNLLGFSCDRCRVEGEEIDLYWPEWIETGAFSE